MSVIRLSKEDYLELFQKVRDRDLRDRLKVVVFAAMYSATDTVTLPLSLYEELIDRTKGR